MLEKDDPAEPARSTIEHRLDSIFHRVIKFHAALHRLGDMSPDDEDNPCDDAGNDIYDEREEP